MGRGARALTCSGVCWQGGDGVPRRSGEALSARFRIPPASRLDCCKRHGCPLGPKALSANSRLSRPLPPALTGSAGAALRTDGGGRTHWEKDGGLNHGLGTGTAPSQIHSTWMTSAGVRIWDRRKKRHFFLPALSNWIWALGLKIGLRSLSLPHLLSFSAIENLGKGTFI